MATKKQLEGIITNPLAKTEGAPARTYDEKRPRPIGIYLSNIDRAKIDTIADKHNLNRHMILQYAVQVFLRDYADGKHPLDTEITAGKINIKLP